MDKGHDDKGIIKEVEMEATYVSLVDLKSLHFEHTLLTLTR